MRLASRDADVIAQGASFLRIVSSSFVATGFAAASMMVLRAVSNVRVSLVVYTASLITNIFFNWVFIFGNMGAPAMGVAGAAVATVIARLVEAAISFTYILCKEDQIRYRIKYTFVKASVYVAEFRRNALPVVINETFWGGAMVTISIIVGRIGTDFTAAFSICMVLGQLVTVAILGAGNASAVIIGNTVGAGEYDLARSRSRSLLFISICMGVVSALILLVLKGPFLSLYGVSQRVLDYAGQFMNIHAGVVFCESVTLVAVIGVLRGGGDARYAAMADLLPTWLFAIPLGFLAGHVLGWSAPLVYFIIKSDELIKPVISIFRLLGGKWVRDVTKNTSRLSEEREENFPSIGENS
jgi:putative MATE family efflux protein